MPLMTLPDWLVQFLSAVWAPIAGIGAGLGAILVAYIARSPQMKEALTNEFKAIVAAQADLIEDLTTRESVLRNRLDVLESKSREYEQWCAVCEKRANSTKS